MDRHLSVQISVLWPTIIVGPHDAEFRIDFYSILPVCLNKSLWRVGLALNKPLFCAANLDMGSEIHICDKSIIRFET